MANSYRAPKQWVLQSDASVTQFESWRNNLLFTLSLDPINAQFLKENATWLKKTKGNPKRGFTDDGAGSGIAEAKRLTADQKVGALELMLGQIANYAPINRATIVKNSTSLKSVWKALRQHLGFQANGARVLDLADMSLKPGERPEELYQRLLAFMDDNLMKTDNAITHLGEEITEDEEVTPSLENYFVVTWLKLIHKDMPELVKMRYATELRSRSLASIKDEISGALDSLLAEIDRNQDAKALRSVINQKNRGTFDKYKSNRKSPKSSDNKECPICKQVGRPNTEHYLSDCRYLPEKDRRFIFNTKARTGKVESDCDESEAEEYDCDDASARSVDVSHTSVARRVPVIQSPYIDTFYKHHSIRVTIDCGATGNFVRLDVVKRINANMRKNTQKSHQADGNSSLQIVGEVSLNLSYKGHKLVLEALVAVNLDDEVLGGTPFMDYNDIWVRPKKRILGIGEDVYEYRLDSPTSLSSNRVQVEVIRSPDSLTVWPGDFVELDVPDTFAGRDVGLEPRTDTQLNSKCLDGNIWPPPQIISCSDKTIRIPNLSSDPKTIRKGEHFCQIRTVSVLPSQSESSIPNLTNDPKQSLQNNQFAFKEINIDPHNITPIEYKNRLESICESYGHVFSPKFTGYNGRDGNVKAVVNMGPVMPPQRKGRMPLYNKDKLTLLQNKFDELEELGVFARPENVGINIEYLNPSFLVKKARGGHRLVTDFGEVAHYAKPQPSLMPDMDSILRSISQWKYIIQSDLCKAYFQIPLEAASMKFCGVATPFKGVRVYVRSAMGMPGSESALEEVMCRVLGTMIESGQVVKLADNLYCGGNSLEELCNNWEQLLKSLSRNNLHLSPSQTIINPKSTNILGWVWSQGTLTASPHSVCTLQTCKRPDTVTQLRSFIGAFKVLARVIPGCAEIMAPLDNMAAGRPSAEKLNWSSQNSEAFCKAQQHISKSTTITLPRKSDKLWIVLDATTKKPAVGSTLYIERESNEFKISGFFSAKVKSNQIDWLPCEREGLSIGSSVKYFQPFIIQSEHKTTVLTDNKPCVQAFSKMQKGEFSASPRVSTFLSICHRFQVSVRHISGVNNALSDFQSRNPAECDDSNCQICRFLFEVDQSVIRAISVQDVIDGKHKIPFLSRTAWQSTQLECPDLRRTHAHLKQGTRPSRKHTNIRDVKRYLNNVTIARDGLIVVRNDEPLATVKERIVVPRAVLDGLISSLHIKLDHPTFHQMKLVAHRYFYALDMDNTVEHVSSTCHLCASLATFEHARKEQSTSDPPDGVCIQFAADVIRRERQYVFLLRDVVTSYTWSLLIDNEQAKSLRDALIKLLIPNKPIDGPPSVVRVDNASGFISLKEDNELKSHGIILDLGRVKNINKNPVGERAVEELEKELLKQDPTGGPVSDITLAVATARLNARIRTRGMSSREMLFQRDQFTNSQIPVSDMELITEQHESKLRNHKYSEKSKAPHKDFRPQANVDIGDLVYLHTDRDKTKSRDRYIIVNSDNDWIYVRKFVGKQLRNASYKIKRSECYKVPSNLQSYNVPISSHDNDTNSDQIDSISNVNPVAIVSRKTLNSNPNSSDSMSELNQLPKIPEAIVPTNNPTSSDTNVEHFPAQNSNAVLEDQFQGDHPVIEQSDNDDIDSSEQPAITERPQRNCRPPDKLSIKWDTSQSYT